MTVNPKIFRTSTFRLAAIYLLVFLLSAGALLSYVFYNTVGLLERQTEDTIRAEVQALGDQYRLRGLNGVVDVISRRIAEDTGTLYLLVNADNDRLIGNLAGLPSQGLADASWVDFPINKGKGASKVLHTARAFHVNLSGGYELLVGRDVEELRAFRNVILNALYWGIGLALVLGLSGGFLMSRNFLKRVDAITETSRTIMAGDLSQRMPVAGSGDELDKLADSLNEMLTQIERLMAGMKEVSSNVAHDLRTPLTRLRARAEAALRSANADEHRAALQQTIVESDRLIQTFNALLSIARAEAGQAREGLDIIDVSEVLRDVAELYEPLVEDVGGSLKLTPFPAMQVRADRQLLSQTFSNVIDNAMKYGGLDGGNAVHITMSGEVDGSDAVIVISDAGQGIAPEDRERVLDRFVRLDDSRTKTGNGLGLSLVASVMKLHGGTLELSDAGPGLKVKLTLPLWNERGNIHLTVSQMATAQNFSQQLTQPFPEGRDDVAMTLFWDACDTENKTAFRLHKSFIEGVVSGSSHMRQLLVDHAAFANEILISAPDAVLREVLLQTQNLEYRAPDEVASALRQLKSKFALLCGLCDLGNVWTLDDVTSAITRFADAAIGAALNALLLEAHAIGKYLLPDPSAPGRDCGYVILAMGKHGAFELNYSSDVDLIVLFDAETMCLPKDAEVTKFFVRLTQRLVSMLQEQTAEGYVFRTDLRLRPDPRATQIAISIQSAEQYYLNLGQNWERAAYIKARAIAGDLALGESFLKTLQPYIWRKYLDFAAIADVQSLIRQIHAVKGHGEIAVEGHNLKLGRGGIREIEFFVQTQQLIAGGRNPALRGRRMVDMLDALADAKWISVETAADLKAAYTVLRQWEHRAQMQRDEQTHNVPSADAFVGFAQFCGFADAETFRNRVRQTLEMVRAHSSKLFEQSSTLGGDAGALVFTGGEDDPETIETLERMGFAQASEVSATIRGWHFGRYVATRDKRSKEALTELMPKLLDALSRSGNADRTFIDFDAFLRGLPAGVQLFAMLKTNPDLLDLLAQILGTAPRLAYGLSRQPRILEAVLDPAFFGPLPSRESLAQSAAALVPPGVPLDESMDRMRVFGREQKFRVGVRVLSETVSAEEAGQGFTNIADTAINTLLAAVREDIERQHGTIEQGRVAVIAMGKLGGREMTAGSDLDLIVVYDHAEDCTQSSGPRAISPSQYYTKLTQRLIAAVSAPTAEGELYEVDMRLRPSGSKGPVAASLSSFNSYQAESAWTWEKLALTRARLISGDASLCSELENVKQKVLAASRDEALTRHDVVSMRGLMLREHKATSPWDIKRVRGGLVEAEFIAQFLQLIHANQHPDTLDTNTLQVFGKLHAAGVLNTAQAKDLADATRLYHRMTQLLRLCIEETFDPTTALSGLNRAVSLAAQTPDVRGAEDLLRQTQLCVATLFDQLVGDPQKSESRATDFTFRSVLMSRSALPQLNILEEIPMKYAVLGALALTMTAGFTLANEPYLPRGERSLQRLDTNKDGRINRDEIKPRMVKRFSAVDANGDKNVTAAEIDTMLQKRIEARRDRMLSLMDANKDGSITEAEYERVADSMFDKADADGNGGVDLAELKGFKRAEWRKTFVGQPDK